MKDYTSDVIRFSSVAIDHRITIVKNVVLSGSACKSTVLSRGFLVQEGHLEQINIQFEIDLEFILIEFPKSLKERVEKSEKNCFTRLKLALDEAYELSLKNGCKFPKEYMQTYCSIGQNGYINPSEIKKTMKQLFKYEFDKKLGEIVLAVCFGKSGGDVKLNPEVLIKSSVMTSHCQDQRRYCF